MKEEFDEMNKSDKTIDIPIILTIASESMLHESGYALVGRIEDDFIVLSVGDGINLTHASGFFTVDEIKKLIKDAETYFKEKYQ